ncbi:MAG: hypothetical protein E3J87_08040 [Candidatus Cloacimonadota bacterium]|nr:MAG: hypothetical protein E3J87_08040 [Candidatus Cloacimonadota bacterium]
MVRRTVPYFFLVLLTLFIILNQVQLDKRMKNKKKLVEELMYFPSGKFISQVACGYDDVLSDFVWLRFIQYYGQEMLTNKEFRYLEHILDILTTLDPRFTVAYTFGALLLVTNVNDPDAGFELLSKGMRANPMKWQLPYMKAFLYYIYLEDYKLAGKFFKIAAHLPNAPDFTRRFAAFVYQRAGSIDISLYLWWELYRATKNPWEQEVAVRSIKQCTIEKIERLIDTYLQDKREFPRTLQVLVKEGFIKNIPLAPDSGEYYINHQKRIVECSTGGYLRRKWKKHL